MRPSLVIASLWLLPLSAWAQSSSDAPASPPPASPPSATTSSAANPGLNKERTTSSYAEIERGFFLGVDVGPSFVINAPASSGPRPFSSGQSVRIEAGYDISELFALSVFIQGSANRAGSDYIGYSGGAASGDFSTLAFGLSGRFNVVGFADAQGVKRTYFYIRVAASYAIFAPKPLLPQGDILVFVGPGIEYYTRLRHFTIGLEVTGSMLARDRAFGFAVTPNLRYAF
jgi:hypothetical protein